MPESLNLLIVAPSDDDAALYSSPLQQEGFVLTWQRVDTESAYRQALAAAPDIVLADDATPQLGASRAVQVLREEQRDIPCVVLADPIGEEAAVTLLRQGADDFLLKEHLDRLGEAVRGAQRERAAHQHQHHLAQTLKMEALERLAGTAAHDMNNLLTVIQGRAQFALEMLSAQDPAREDVQAVLKATTRATHLTRQLLLFSHRHVGEMRPLNLNQFLQGMSASLTHLLGEDITLRLRLSNSVLCIHADPELLEQAITSLATNAREAMPQGGCLSIETAPAPPAALSLAPATNGADTPPQVLLRVRDSGCGMSEEVKAHLFEPFFTTKGSGLGTGLGLATVYGVIAQCRGTITVESAPRAGTTMSICLPTLPEQEARAMVASPSSHPRGGETILVVDDQEDVRIVTARHLRALGYEVLVAASASEAIALCQSRAEPLGLLLSDMMMPEISGSALVERLREIRADFAILFMSGYSEEQTIRYGALQEEIMILPKPFTKESLAHAVRQALDSGGL
jgi:two-component system, cell cycle sensor histidine kinase and response regulator CckA